MPTHSRKLIISYVYPPLENARTVERIIHELVDEAVKKALMSYASK